MCVIKQTVIEIADEEEADVSLENSLRFWWKMSYYGCFLLDWCRKIHNKSKLYIVAQWIGLLITTVSFTSLLAFQLIQLILEWLKKDSATYSIILNLVWFCIIPGAIAPFFTILHQRKKLLSFFKHFHQLEKQLPYLATMKNDYQATYRLVYGINAFACLLLGVGGGIVIFWEREASYFLSYYAIFRDTFTTPGIMIYHLFCGTLQMVFINISVFVPGWTFYHIGLALRSLKCEVELHHYYSKANTISTEEYVVFQHIKLRFESVNRLTEKANQLFGLLMAVDYLTAVFMICTLAYAALGTLKEADWKTYAYAAGLLLYIVRLLTSVLLTGQLHTSSQELIEAVSIDMVNYDTFCGEEYYRSAILFLNRMNQSRLVARPLNLFDVTPSTLLSVSGLIISYVIILLQLN